MVRGFGGGAWTPNSNPSVKIWLDSTDTSTITTVGGVGTKVTAWKDKSPNAYNWTQGTDAKRFTLTATAVNSLQAMASAGSLGMTGPANMFISTSSAWTWACAGRLNAYNGHYATLFFFSDGGGVNPAYTFTWADSTQTGYKGFNTGINSGWANLLYNNGGLSTGTTFKVIVTYSGSSPTSSGSFEIWFNGTSETVTTNSGGWNSVLDLTGTTIGTPDAIYAGLGMTGYIGEILHFTTKNAGLTAQINTYLSRWGV